ncbi:hypothetical protein N7495_007248 [Penicillium taxi]|uniref:uncharacterized protein n=1 Tax=Penicillium taxi TaxID=168475 RepID=UPI002545A10B|nr:uncharacterized protein N7495_007248 [Penicillium taxi]KAJ5895557.1 hypothetical protein N7495_007248 [Penicillium taxi]
MPRALSLSYASDNPAFSLKILHIGLHENAVTGTIYHATKELLKSGQTLYEPVLNMFPVSTNSLRASVEIASGLKLTDQELDVQCRSAAIDRSFDIVFNNCQRLTQL